MGALDPVPEFRRSNIEYARTFTQGDLPVRASTNVLIITCVDSRVDPAHFLGLDPGSAYIYRSSGGRVTADTFRTVLLTELLGCRRIMVVHHTDCALNRGSNEELREKIRTELKLDPSDIDFLPCSSPEESVRIAVSRLRASPLLLEDVEITAHIYDVKSGRMEDVPHPTLSERDIR
jgi:carbonic anhydrase